MVEFHLQPEEKELQTLAAEYWEKNPGELELEKAAFAAGSAIREGAYTLENLEAILRWKSPRSIPHLRKNTEDEIRRALEVAAFPSSSTECAFNSLRGLSGVEIPVASAILTAIFPEQHTVIDFRALEALGHPPLDVKFYREYLEFCKSLAAKGVIAPQSDKPAPTALRALDRALWQWSANDGSESGK